MSVPLAGVCPAIILGLEQTTGGRPSDLVTQVGFTQSLLDPTNTAGSEIKRNTQGTNGNFRKVTVTYRQRATPEDVRSEKSCDAGPNNTLLTEDYAINMSAHHSFTMDEADVRRICNALEAYVALPIETRNREGRNNGQLQVMGEIAAQFYRDIDAVRVKMNRDLLAAFALRVGDFAGGAPSKTYTFLQDSNYAMILKGFLQMKRDVDLIGFRGRPIAFGDGNLGFAMDAAEYGCCNDFGQDFGVMRSNAPAKFYRDLEAGTTLGDPNAFGILIPGMAQLLHANEYVGDYTREIDGMYRGTIPDPSIPGLRYDFEIWAERCPARYMVQVSAYYDLFVAPSDMFKTTDRLNQVNGTMKAIAAAA